MKALAVALSCLLISPAGGQETRPPAAPTLELPPVVITAPSPRETSRRRLKEARTAGLVFAGGLTAYLSHRRLRERDDFGPGNVPPGKEKGVPRGTPSP